MLREQISHRLENPSAQPPAWQQLLLTVYSDFPPPTLSAAEREAELRTVGTTAPMSAGVLKALRRAMVVYHPDKNRKEVVGEEWAATAEEVTKMASWLFAHYGPLIGE